MMDEPTTEEVEKLILEMGIPTETPTMFAEQLLKRARQLSERRNQSLRDSLDHLIGLLKQGWAAKKNLKSQI